MFRIAVVVVIFNKIYASVVVISQLSFFGAWRHNNYLVNLNLSSMLQWLRTVLGFRVGLLGNLLVGLDLKFSPTAFCSVLFYSVDLLRVSRM